MAVSESSSFKSRRVYRSIGGALASAALEWMLIFMLFVDAILSFLITKFASVCELQTPCLLCSRLDHILGNRRLKYYWDLICRNHKLEISSLVLCHAHNKLVDVQGMCENCLFSFATFNKSNAETYRLLVGKLGENSSFDLDQEGHIPKTKSCSCCNEPWIPRWSGQRLKQTRSVASEAADRDVHLSDSFRYNFHNKRKKNGAVSIDASMEKSSRLDPLSHVQYAELNIDSDDESEVMLRDNDHAHTPIHEFIPKEDDTVESIHPEPFIIHQPDDLLSEKNLDPISVSQQPFSKLQSDVTESHSSADTISKVQIGHGLEELNWEQEDCKVEPSVFPELISLDEVPPPSIPKETLVGEESTFISVDEVPPSSTTKECLLEVSRENNLTSQDGISQLHDNGETHADASEGFPIPINSIPSSISNLERVVQDLYESKLIFPNDSLPTESEKNPVGKSDECNLADVPPSMNTGEIPTEELKQSSIATHEIKCETPVMVGDQTSKADSKPAASEIASETIQVPVDSAQQALNLLDLSDAYRLAVGNRGRQLSGVLAEQWMGKDSSKLSEDLRQLLSQLSASRENPSSDMSPRFPVSPKISLNSDEVNNSDSSNVIGMQILQKRISLERNESNISLEGSLVSEIEGESVADRLKRQVEHDKKLLSALYKELEEERSASAIAANQSMAMITRLQEEKATLHMEALQCLRMMEEQAEYDMEALQKTSDLLTEREKDIQDLEAELEYYRTKFPDELMLDDHSNYITDLKATDVRMNRSEGCLDTFRRVDDEASTNKNSLLEFEDESSYILQKLQKLEKKLYIFSNNVPCSDLVDGEYCTDQKDGINEFQELNDKPNSTTDENGLLIQNKVKHDHDPLPAKSDTIDMEDTGVSHSSRQSTQASEVEADLSSLVNEVHNLNKRLQALEADRNFLEHSINSIKSGEEGVQFIQDIASQLKEIRKIGIMRTQQIIQ